MCHHLCGPFSGLDFVHLQKEASAEEILEAKAAFKWHALSMGAIIKGHHADNGIFEARA